MSRERKPDPPPLETNDVAIVAGGSLAWAVACLALLIARFAGADVHSWWIVMCASGAALGLVGVRYCQRRRDAIARDARATNPG